MVIYLLLELFITLITFVLSLVPVIETPAWLVTNLPQIFTMIFAFNQYLPVYEAFTVAVWLIAGTMSYKFFKVILNLTGVDLTK